MTEKKLEEFRNELRNTIFFASDFKDGAGARNWWRNEFKTAAKLSEADLKKWAKDTKEYLYDFEVYYIREEIENMLNRIIRAR